MAKQKPFNNPFGAVKLKAEPKPAPKPAPKQHAVTLFDEAPREPLGDDARWEQEMQGVKALADRSEVVRPKAQPIVHAQGPAASVLDVRFDGETLEGTARGVPSHVLEGLKRGEPEPELKLDLHGLGEEQARSKLTAFVSRAQTEGKRCVLVVTGRGLHSRGGVPVLKEAVAEWFARGRLARAVIAFCTARPQDGGSGAFYLLLKS